MLSIALGVVSIIAVFMSYFFRAMWLEAGRRWRRDTYQHQDRVRGIQADLKQGHACNACLKDQLEHGKRQCCVGPDSCDVDGEILRLRAEVKRLEEERKGKVLLREPHVIDVLTALKFFKKHTNKGPVTIIEHYSVNDCIIIAVEQALKEIKK